MECSSQVFLVWAALLFVTWPSDVLVGEFVKTLPAKSLLRASDTAVHGFIGAFSWQLMCLLCPALEFNLTYQVSRLISGRSLLDGKNTASLVNSLLNISLAFALSCIIDVDHVFKDLIQSIQGGPRAPWERGVLHLSLPPLVTVLLLYATAMIFKQLWCLKCGTIIIACVLSHHIRDGIRRGLWFQPIGTTPVLPYWLYVVITLILPFAVGGLASKLSAWITASQPVSDTSLVAKTYII
ncbi:transmembrane protein 267-like isoform X2 [Penaeus monodon]|nr:transmembrane protein 267-like isoform X2 [Penaeus monodon]